MSSKKASVFGYKVGLGAVAGAVALMCASVGAQAQAVKPHFINKKPKMIDFPEDVSLDTNGASAPVRNATGPFVFGFEGVSQYDGASLGRNFIPPDTMGAVGRTQYMQTSNGAYAVFDKATGTRTALMSDVAFWAAAGQTGANGDSRIMYNAAASRWIAISFGDSVADIQVAVSNSDNALGGWKSTKFTGYAGGTADYPTLALDRNAVYIGTNNFAPTAVCDGGRFCGTTMNVIPLNSLFGAGAPTTTNMKQFVNPYPPGTPDRGFALQGVNSKSAGSTGKVVAAGLFYTDASNHLGNVAYNVTGLSSTDATGASQTVPVAVGIDAATTAGPGRQPSVAVLANKRIIDTLDERISSSVYEVNGRIYAVQTVNPDGDGLDEARVHYSVLDASTFAVLSQGDIGTAGYDYYQGSIAVNSSGQVVIGYNRSGYNVATGNISIFAQTFNTAGDGSLISTSGEILIKESLTDDYHNGSAYGSAAAGRQRWGDYSQVSVDPEDDQSFWMIGEFAREYNRPDDGHPGGSGFSRWGTYISQITVTAVPEASTWAMMILGFGIIGGIASRRRRRTSERSLAA